MIVAAAVALLLLPVAVLRGKTLATYYATSAALVLFAWLMARQNVRVDAMIVAAIVFATLLVFLAMGEQVRLSANKAALLAIVVYAFLVPPMTQVPIDGDEPYYLLVTESLVHDFDLDLANQYRDIAHTASGRIDLKPQLGDPTGPRGAQYSRTEPFLSLLLVPGYFFFGLRGAVATIALFGVLLVRSTIRWLEEEGMSADAIRAVFPLFAFAPPILFYAARIWPEVPAAFLFVECLRGIRAQRFQRWLPALFALVMLKLRFVLIAVGLIALQARKRRTLVVVAVIAIPMLLLWSISGSPLNVHSWRELLPTHPERYAIGFFGLLLDGAAGIAFQAPFYLLGIFALLRWRETPQGFRAGILASLLYVLYLLPRDEWHGGWSPPLRYLVFLMPVLALGAAAMWDRIPRGVVVLIATWTFGIALHGLAYPWRLFHIANGENAIGEWLSVAYRADFSRLFPSFIRINDAAWIGAVALLAILVFARFVRVPSHGIVAAASLAIAFGFVIARQPAGTIHFEDAHVVHEGGALYPSEYTPIRFAYRGGWVINANESLSFLAREGAHTLHYVTGPGARIAIEGVETRLPPSQDRYTTARVVVPHRGRVTLRCLEGAVNLDKLVRDAGAGMGHD